jgi:hypothetical protein
MTKKYKNNKKGIKLKGNNPPDNLINFLLNYSNSLETVKTKITTSVVHKN